ESPPGRARRSQQRRGDRTERHEHQPDRPHDFGAHGAMAPEQNGRDHAQHTAHGEPERAFLVCAMPVDHEHATLGSRLTREPNEATSRDAPHAAIATANGMRWMAIRPGYSCECATNAPAIAPMVNKAIESGRRLTCGTWMSARTDRARPSTTTVARGSGA